MGELVHVAPGAVTLLGHISGRPMNQADGQRMIGRRAEGADVRTKIGFHTFRPSASPNTYTAAAVQYNLD